MPVREQLITSLEYGRISVIYFYSSPTTQTLDIRAVQTPYFTSDPIPIFQHWISADRDINLILDISISIFFILSHSATICTVYIL